METPGWADSRARAFPRPEDAPVRKIREKKGVRDDVFSGGVFPGDSGWISILDLAHDKVSEVETIHPGKRKFVC
jgi:hypothetical protein